MTPSERVTQLFRENKIKDLVIGGRPDGIYIDFSRSEDETEIIAPENFNTIDEALQWVIETHQKPDSEINWLRASPSPTMKKKAK